MTQTRRPVAGRKPARAQALGPAEAVEGEREGLHRAVEKVLKATEELFDSLEVQGPPHDRDEEKRKAQERGKKRDAQLRARLLGAS
jgi:hypothetical protein